MQDGYLKGTAPDDESYDYELVELKGSFFGVRPYEGAVPTITQYPRNWSKNSAVLHFKENMYMLY